MPGLDDPGDRVETAQGRAEPGRGVRVDQVELVEDQDVRELDLVHEQIAHRALVVLERGEAARGELVAAVQLGQEVGGVHDGDHGVEEGDVPEGGAVVAGEGERGRHRQRFRDSRAR